MLDPQLTIYNRVWAIIRSFPAYQALGIKLTSEYDSTATPPGTTKSDQRQGIRTSPGEYPSLRIDASSETDLNNVPVTFCDTPDHGVPITVNLDFKLIWDSVLLQNMTPLESAVRGALIAADRKLAIPWTSTPGIQWVGKTAIQSLSRVTEVTTESGGTRRTVLKFRLVVNGMPKKSLFAA